VGQRVSRLGDSAISRLVSAAGFRVLDALNAHRYLTLRQIRAYLGDTSPLYGGTTDNLIRTLKRQGFIEGCPVEARGMNIWFLSETGLKAIPLKRRGKYLPSMANAGGMDHRHTWGVNAVGIAFSEAARRRAGDEFGLLALEHEIKLRDTGTASSLVIADGILQYYVASDLDRGDFETAILELDRTTSPKVLANRLRSYAEIRRTKKLWEKPLPDGWPTILFVIADDPLSGPRVGERYWAGDPARSAARTDRLVRYIGKAAEKEAGLGRLSVLLAPLPALIESGPFAPIWRRPGAPEPVDWLGRPAMIVLEGGAKGIR